MKLITALKINEKIGHTGSSWKIRFPSGIFNMMPRRLQPLPPLLALRMGSYRCPIRASFKAINCFLEKILRGTSVQLGF